MSRRATILAAILVFALYTSFMPVQTQGATVTEVSHSPNVPKSGEDVEITLRFDNASTIKGIHIICCTIEPLFKCEFPVNMTKDATNGNMFTYTITKDYDAGTLLGFKFRVSYENGSFEYIPASLDDSDIHPVEGPYEGSYYYTFTLEQDPFPLYLVAILVIVIVVVGIAAVVLLKKKGKGKKHEDED